MKQFLAVICALVCVSMCFAGCGDNDDGEKAAAGDTAADTAAEKETSGEPDLAKPNTVDGSAEAVSETDTGEVSYESPEAEHKTEYTLSEYFNSKDPLILYAIDSGSVAKNKAPTGFYLVENGKISYYFGTQEMQDAYIDRERKRNILTNTNILSADYNDLNDAYEQAKRYYSQLEEEYQQEFSFSALSKMTDEEIIGLIKEKLVAEYVDSDIQIAVYTDSSGNNTHREQVITSGHKLLHSYNSFSGETVDQVGEPINDSDILSFNHFDDPLSEDISEVYDSDYIMLFTNGFGYFVRIGEEELDYTVSFDAPDAQGVLVDPE